MRRNHPDVSSRDGASIPRAAEPTVPAVLAVLAVPAMPEVPLETRGLIMEDRGEPSASRSARWAFATAKGGNYQGAEPNRSGEEEGEGRWPAAVASKSDSGRMLTNRGIPKADG
ncbi:hypothetical protein KM043_004976 [Ampulex compressa]|nr:hypothetical protein KM043_004976 [Ampulex compressa]